MIHSNMQTASAASKWNNESEAGHNLIRSPFKPRCRALCRVARTLDLAVSGLSVRLFVRSISIGSEDSFRFVFRAPRSVRLSVRFKRQFDLRFSRCLDSVCSCSCQERSGICFEVSLDLNKILCLPESLF